jgi:diguanylate cyclase (GGDEF)-like protein/PAS domain S-box-containing protein
MVHSKLAVLLVSRSPAQAGVVRSALTGVGVDPARVLTWVQSAGEAAVETAARDFDCVLFDLPGAGAITELTALLAGNDTVPVIALVEAGDTDLAHAALRRGAQDHLPQTDLDGRLLLRSVEYARERHRAHVELRHTEHLYSSVVDALTEGIIVYSASGRIQTANASAARILGTPVEELTGLAAGDGRWEAMASDGTPFPAAQLPSSVALRTGEVVHGTVMGVTRADGEFAWLQLNATPMIRDAGAPPYAVVVSLRDITLDHAVDQAVRDLERRQRLILQNATEGYLVADATGRVTAASVAPEGRHTWDALPGTDVYALLHAEDSPRLRTAFAEVLDDPWTPRSVEVRVAENSWVELTVTNNLHEPTVGGIVLNHRDITQRRAHAEAMNRLSAIVESSDASIFSTNPDGMIESWNRAAGRLYGYTPGEVAGLHVSMLGSPERAVEFDDLMRRVRAGERVEQFETVRRRKDGTLIDVSLTLSPIANSSGELVGFSSITRDITEGKRRDAEAQQDRRRLAEAQRLAQLGSFEIDADDGIMRWSAELHHLLGVAPDSAPTMHLFLSRVHPDDLPAVNGQVRAVLDRGESTEGVFRVRRGDDVRWVHLRAHVIGDEGRARVAGTVVDVTERRRMEDERRVAEIQLRMGIENAAVGIVMIDSDHCVTMANRAMCTLLGRAEDDLVGTPVEDALHPEDAPTVLSRLRALARGDLDSYRAERRYLRADGSTVWALVNVAVVPDPEGAAQYFFAQVQDITDRKAMEDALEHLAVHDALTQLPNRALLTDRVEHALGQLARRGGDVAVLFIDVDGFKFVNDGMGHRAGDELLTVVADRLRGAVRPSDTVARFGGDEFVVVCEQLAGPWEATRIGDRVARAVEEPMTIDGREVVVTASIGIALAGPNATADGLLRDADTAMYRAKERGRARVEVFDDALRGRAAERLELEGALRRALSAGEFELAYQPIVRLDDSTVVGAEALLRWRHPARGIVAPADFIPLAEETGLIVPIGAWVLGEALQQAQTWRAAGHELSISVNLSARQLMWADLVDTVRSAVHRSGIDPRAVHLEITESVLMDDVEHSIGTLTTLRDLGIHFEVDDFGTGYSSLSYLQRLPIDTLKIDRSFVDGLGTEGHDPAIVRAIVGLGRALGMNVHAEGVEQPGELAELRTLGCDLAQGYLWSPALPAADFPLP